MRHRLMKIYPKLVVLACLSSLLVCGQTVPAHKTTRVVWVMTDGLRWQEVFAGADAGLLKDADRKDFWRDSADERRAVLMPFLWSVVAKDGTIRNITRM